MILDRDEMEITEGFYKSYKTKANDKDFWLSTKMIFNMANYFYSINDPADEDDLQERARMIEQKQDEAFNINRQIACYVALKEKNESRSRWNRFFHPIQNYREKRELEIMDKVLKLRYDFSDEQILAAKNFIVSDRGDKYVGFGGIGEHGQIIRNQPKVEDKKEASIENLESDSSIKPLNLNNSISKKVVNKEKTYDNLINIE